MGVPRVSVILAVHNCEAYIRRAVASVLEQDFEDLELLVVDDGSTDSTRGILESCAASDSRVVLLLNDTNRGIVYSRNRALDAARGSLLAGQDADDISLSPRLQRQVDFFDSHPDVGMLGTWAMFIDENDVVLPGHGLRPSTENAVLQEELLDRSLFCAPSVVFRRELLRQIGPYDSRLPYSHDYDLFLRLSEVTRISNLPEPLYLYRQHQSTVTSRHRPLQMYYKAQALGFAINRRWSGNPPATVRELLTRDYLRASYLASKAGQTELAHRAYADAREVSATLAASGTVLETAIGRYAAQPFPMSHLEAVERFFDEVCEKTELSGRVRQKLVAKLSVRALREALEAGETGRFDQLLWDSVQRNPQGLFDRSVLAMIRHRLLHTSPPPSPPRVH